MVHLQFVSSKSEVFSSVFFKLGTGNLPDMSRSWLVEQQADDLVFYQVHWNWNPCATAPLLWCYANISLIIFLLLYFPLRIQKLLSTGWVFMPSYCHQIDLWFFFVWCASQVSWNGFLLLWLKSKPTETRKRSSLHYFYFLRFVHSVLESPSYLI